VDERVAGRVKGRKALVDKKEGGRLKGRKALVDRREAGLGERKEGTCG
jgi:hypothetical protein